jgi:hypothetical protein
MKRQNVDLVSLSFLDVLMSALGAVIFLFIVVPKLPNVPNKTIMQAVADYSEPNVSTFYGSDFRQNTPYYFIPHKTRIAFEPNYKIGYLTQNNKMYSEQYIKNNSMMGIGYGRYTDSDEENGVSKRLIPSDRESFAAANRLIPIVTNQDSIQKNLQSLVKEYSQLVLVNSEREKKLNACEKNIRRPSYACKLAFEIKWEDPQNNVDLYVVKGDQYVCGKHGYRSNPTIGDWDSGKSRNRIFNNDLRTNQEAVRQFNSLTAGEYQLFAQLKEMAKPDSVNSVNLSGLIYTQNDKGEELSTTFNSSVSLNPNARQIIGHVFIQPDGTFVFNKL